MFVSKHLLSDLYIIQSNERQSSGTFVLWTVININIKGENKYYNNKGRSVKMKYKYNTRSDKHNRWQFRFVSVNINEY